MAKKITEEILCLFFIALFVHAGLAKLIDHDLFVTQISQNKPLEPFAGFLSIALPVVELLISLLIAIPRFRRLGLYAFTSLMAIFSIYITIILSFAEDIPCSCGGILSGMGWRTHLIFNILTVALAVGAIKLQRINHSTMTTQLA